MLEGKKRSGRDRLSRVAFNVYFLTATYKLKMHSKLLEL
jgi:hypothetical protein